MGGETVAALIMNTVSSSIGTATRRFLAYIMPWRLRDSRRKSKTIINKLQCKNTVWGGCCCCYELFLISPSIFLELRPIFAYGQWTFFGHRASNFETIFKNCKSTKCFREFSICWKLFQTLRPWCCIQGDQACSSRLQAALAEEVCGCPSICFLKYVVDDP